MSQLPYHEYSRWEMFRNESIEAQNRRDRIQQTEKNAVRQTTDGLLWPEQRWVNQTVPAEMVNPDNFDTFKYRYQVYARPPPTQCEPVCLSEVTDIPPPPRYNVRRVAVDKPVEKFETGCSAHHTSRPWRMDCYNPSCGEGAPTRGNHDGGFKMADCTGNNNIKTKPPRESDARSCSSSMSSMSHVSGGGGPAASIGVNNVHNSSQRRLSENRNNFNNSCSSNAINNADTTDGAHQDNTITYSTHRNSNNNYADYDYACQDNASNVNGEKPVQKKTSPHYGSDSFNNMMPGYALAEDRKRIRREARDKMMCESRDPNSIFFLNSFKLTAREAEEHRRAAQGLPYRKPPQGSKTPGYGTYEMIGGHQYAETPVPLHTNFKLRPDLEEYREFTKRCPNYKLGRFDRNNPMNEIIMPANKSSITIKSCISPFQFLKNPRGGNLPPLFRSTSQEASLDWAIPASIQAHITSGQGRRMHCGMRAR